MADVTFDGSLLVRGRTTLQGGIALPLESVGNDNIIPDDPIDADKLQQQKLAQAVLSNHATAATVMRVPLHLVLGATGLLLRFGVSASVPASGGGAKATIDLLKNGSSILSAPFDIDTGDAAYALVEGAISSAGVVTTDQLDVSVTAVSATAPKGLCAWLWLNEDAIS